MLNLDSLAISADQARAARNYYGLSQAKAAEASSLPLHKIKRFEAGNFIPDAEFLEELRAYYEGRGYGFDDTPQPGARAKDEGRVFPAGVVGKATPAELDSSPRRRPEQSQVQHMRIALKEPDLGHALDLIDANEEKIEELLDKPVEVGIFGGFSEASQARHAEILKRLAENGALFARVFGREVGGKAKPEMLLADPKPKTHADLLHARQADMHGAVAADRAAKARLHERPPAKTVLGALFG